MSIYRDESGILRHGIVMQTYLALIDPPRDTIWAWNTRDLVLQCISSLKSLSHSEFLFPCVLVTPTRLHCPWLPASRFRFSLFLPSLFQWPAAKSLMFALSLPFIFRLIASWSAIMDGYASSVKVLAIRLPDYEFIPRISAYVATKGTIQIPYHDHLHSPTSRLGTIPTTIIDKIAAELRDSCHLEHCRPWLKVHQCGTDPDPVASSPGPCNSGDQKFHLNQAEASIFANLTGKSQQGQLSNRESGKLTELSAKVYKDHYQTLINQHGRLLKLADDNGVSR